MRNYLFYVRKRLFGKNWMMFLNIMVSSFAMIFLCLAVTIPQILLHGENLIKMLSAAALALAAVIFLAKIYISSEATIYELRYILWGNIPIFLLLCAGGVAFLCSLIPMAYIENRSIPDIVRGTCFFSLLFFLSFLASFLVMYYGLDRNRELARAGSAREDLVYEYTYVATGSFAEDIENSGDIPEEGMPGGNIIFGCEGPVGEGVLNVDDIRVVWSREEFTEPVEYEDYYADSDAIPAPKCIIGDAWADETYVIDGIRYIHVFKIECCVIGKFISNTFEGVDERCMIFREDLSREQLDRLFFDSNWVCMIYESNLSDETEAFKSWIRTFLTEENFDVIEKGNWIAMQDVHAFPQYMFLLRKVCQGMLLLCFVNCAFLAYFHGVMHLYEYMLKRALGYGRLKLFADILWQFAVFEMLALAAALFITCGYELLQGDLRVWYDNIRLGFMRMVGIFVLFGGALSLFPMWTVLRKEPAEVLKNID